MAEADLTGELRRRWTYAELHADARRLASALLSRYRPGDRICVWAPNVPEWVIREYAAAMAGLTLVTANPAYQPRELRYVLQQSGAAGPFLIAEHRGNPMARIAEEVAADLPALRELVDSSRKRRRISASGTSARRRWATNCRTTRVRVSKSRRFRRSRGKKTDAQRGPGAKTRKATKDAISRRS